jgi:hypothetical protein
MRTIPAEVVLAWPTPNYDDPVTRGSALMLVNAIFIGLVLITVFARLWTRLFITRWFGLDDVFVVLALVRTASNRRISPTNMYRCSPSVWQPLSC